MSAESGSITRHADFAQPTDYGCATPFTPGVVLDASDSPMQASREEPRFGVISILVPSGRWRVTRGLNAVSRHRHTPQSFRLESIKVMQRTFNPQNRERYPGEPPFCRIG
jgi:hypothetical protein